MRRGGKILHNASSPIPRQDKARHANKCRCPPPAADRTSEKDTITSRMEEHIIETYMMHIDDAMSSSGVTVGGPAVTVLVVWSPVGARSVPSDVCSMPRARSMFPGW